MCSEFCICQFLWLVFCCDLCKCFAVPKLHCFTVLWCSCTFFVNKALNYILLIFTGVLFCKLFLCYFCMAYVDVYAPSNRLVMERAQYKLNKLLLLFLTPKKINPGKVLAIPFFLRKKKGKFPLAYFDCVSLTVLPTTLRASDWDRGKPYEDWNKTP